MYKRNLSQDFVSALKDTPVLLINGARQVGKSTLVKNLATNHTCYTMDDSTTLASVKRDPEMFLNGISSPIIIDEVQRVPELLLPIKKRVDESRNPGFFILTGSANVLSLPKISDSLAGRMEIQTLWALSQGELRGHKEDFINTVFNLDLEDSQKLITLDELTEVIVTGGYPEITYRKSASRQNKWFSSYITTILEKDIRELENIEGLVDLPKLLRLFASRCASLLNTSEVSRAIGIPNTTLKRYIALLEKTYLLVQVPAWSKNLAKRLIKTPKIYLNDTGLLTHLIDFDRERLKEDRIFLGHVLENFVVMELKKQMTWSLQRTSMYHYRTHGQKEVDIILEAPDSRSVAIEVKLSGSVTPKDFAGIDSFREDVGELFHRGIVFYMGDKIVPFGERKFAVPLPTLWEK